MVDDDAVGALLGLQVEALGEPHSYVFLGLEQVEDLCLIFQIRARWVSKRVAGAAIFLMEEIGNARRIFGSNTEKFAHLFVSQLCQRLGRFHREAVQIKVLGEVAALE